METTTAISGTSTERGTWLADVVAHYLEGFGVQSDDERRTLRHQATHRQRSEVFVFLKVGERGVAADLI